MAVRTKGDDVEMIESYRDIVVWLVKSSCN